MTKHHFREGVSLERRGADEEFVGDDSQAVQVRPLVLRAFGRQVGGRAEERAGPGDARQVDPLAIPKSASFATPSEPTRMFDGLTSR